MDITIIALKEDKFIILMIILIKAMNIIVIKEAPFPFTNPYHPFLFNLPHSKYIWHQINVKGKQTNKEKDTTKNIKAKIGEKKKKSKKRKIQNKKTSKSKQGWKESAK